MPVELHIKYDRVVDALYIRLKNDEIAESDEDTPGVIVDYNKDNEIIGIEILQASKRRIDLLKLLLEDPKALISMARKQSIA